jgi:hypothetical protein
VLLTAVVVAGFALVGAFFYWDMVVNFNYEIRNDTTAAITLEHCGSTSPKSLAPQTSIKIHRIDGACAVYSPSGSTQRYVGCLYDFGEGGYVRVPTNLDPNRAADQCR